MVHMRHLHQHEPDNNVTFEHHQRHRNVPKSRYNASWISSNAQPSCLGSDSITQRVDIALVTSLFRASSFFFRSSEFESSISSCAMASLSAVSIFSFVLPLSLRDIVGSEVISSTREMYDSSCCRASNFLLKASSLFLNLAASELISVPSCVCRFFRTLTANHVLDLARRQLTDGVGNCDICTSSRCLLCSSNLEDTVDVDFEDDLKNGITSLHRWYGCKGEFTQRGVVLAIDPLSLEHRKLHSLLVICDSSESSVI